MELTTSTTAPTEGKFPTTSGNEEHPHHQRNVYQRIRHIFLIISVLCALSIIIFLMYQNGKIIYDNGL